jgi:hypothetical protein
MADLQRLLKLARKRFPALEDVEVDIVRSRGGGYAETLFSGFDGAEKDTIELRDLSEGLNDEQLAGIVAGEIISHILPERSSEFGELINNFGLTTTDEQFGIGRRFFKRLINEGSLRPEQINRGFPDFFYQVFLPSQVRGLVTPEFNEEAAQTLTTPNLQAGRPILDYLKRKPTIPSGIGIE